MGIVFTDTALQSRVTMWLVTGTYRAASARPAKANPTKPMAIRGRGLISDRRIRSWPSYPFARKYP